MYNNKFRMSKKESRRIINENLERAGFVKKDDKSNDTIDNLRNMRTSSALTKRSSSKNNKMQTLTKREMRSIIYQNLERASYVKKDDSSNDSIDNSRNMRTSSALTKRKSLNNRKKIY